MWPGRWVWSRRIVRSALHQAEQALTARVAGRLRALVAVDVPDDDTGQDSVLALIKSVPGNVSLDSMLTEIRKPRAVRAVDCPTDCSRMSPRGWSRPDGQPPGPRRLTRGSGPDGKECSGQPSLTDSLDPAIKTCWRTTATAASLPVAVREDEEVVPVNAVSTWVLPSGVTVGR